MAGGQRGLGSFNVLTILVSNVSGSWQVLAGTQGSGVLRWTGSVLGTMGPGQHGGVQPGAVE